MPLDRNIVSSPVTFKRPMFSGIVEETAQVVSVVRSSSSSRLVVKSSLNLSDVRIGDSIAIEGVCLTVVERRAEQLSFDLAEETLRCSTMSELRVGSLVNFERSLKMGDRIHGHLVFGHVDATVELVARYQEGTSVALTFAVPKHLNRYLAAKGSVALAGTSLTIGEVDQKYFRVYLIPHTQEMTTILQRQVGQRVNLEVDMLARYVANIIEVGNHSEHLDQEFLRLRGFEVEDKG